MKLALTFLASSLAALTAFGGDRGVIGVAVQAKPDFWVITSVSPDGPAARAGIRVGDQIVAIGNVPPLKTRTVQEFLRKVSGPPGSEIELQLKRPDQFASPGSSPSSRSRDTGAAQDSGRL